MNQEMRECAQFLPFLTLLNPADPGAQMWKHPITVRLAEAVIIGALAMYGSVQGLQQELRFVRQQSAQVEKRIEKLELVLRQIEQDNWRRRGIESRGEISR